MSELIETENRLDDLANQVAARLAELDKKVVFAESCTGGKMAATMTTIPGISSYFCGSAVTYREDTKTQWLSVAESDLAEHTAVSEFTSASMARNVFAETPEADYSVAITGHLGPGVDAEIDGKVYVTVGQKRPGPAEFTSNAYQLEGSNRKIRQAEAALLAFGHLLRAMSRFGASHG